MKKGLALVALAIVAAFALCLVGCSGSSENTETKFNHSDIYMTIDGKTYKSTETTKLRESMHKSPSEFEGKTIEIFTLVNKVAPSNTSVKIGNANQYGYLETVGSFRIPIINKSDAAKFKQDDFVLAEGTIGKIDLHEIDIYPLADGSLPIEKKGVNED